MQAGTTCGLIQNFVLKVRMLRFLRHSQQNNVNLVFEAKKTDFSIPATKMQCFQILLVLRPTEDGPRLTEDSLADLLVLTNSVEQKEFSKILTYRQNPHKLLASLLQLAPAC